NAGYQGEISERSLQALRSHARGAAVRSISRDRALSQIAERFESNDLKAKLLKGAAMDSAVYPREAFRLGCDVDMLVCEKDFERVEGLLSGLAENIEKTPGRPATTAFAVEKTFVINGPVRVQIDVHREVTVPHVFPIDYVAMFARCETHPAFDGKFGRLSDEDNLLQFAMHSFYDLQMFSKQTVDACMLMKRGQIDWETLIERAQTYRVMLPLKYLIEGVRHVFGYSPPGAVVKRLKLHGARKWLAYRLLTKSPRWLSGPGPGFRVRQLAAQVLLSGNVRGWLWYYSHYAGAKLRDFWFVLFRG
ncbi:MAG: nucleotidyltransferase family protein, partial [Xanthomonadales bacterium]|nr:nucleotidyltransferase family protein [Xanthomonadales bacterium]